MTLHAQTTGSNRLSGRLFAFGARDALRTPWWLPGGNAQTIASALWARRCHGEIPRFARERWTTPDGDFIDVDEAEAIPPVRADAPGLVLFHGLEGSSSSHYAQAFADAARARGWAFAVPHFRGCSGEINRGPRAYHSGDHAEIDWVLRRFRDRWPQRTLYAVGVSLGGNALMRWTQEAGEGAPRLAAAVCAIGSPLDLAAAGAAIDRGFNRWAYARMFLRTMHRKARAKAQQYPGLFDLNKALQARTLYAFDNVFTAPLHGFKDTQDYWARASAKPRLREVRVPALLINALNDPFVPAHSLPGRHDVSDWVRLWQPKHGGHVGFCEADRPWDWRGHVRGLPERVLDWLALSAGGGHG